MADKVKRWGIKMTARRIFYTALVWIICAVADAFFPKWGFQFASGLWTGVYWGPWLHFSGEVK